jgi:hypothetical protein
MEEGYGDEGEALGQLEILVEWDAEGGEQYAGVCGMMKENVEEKVKEKEAWVNCSI